LGVVVWLVEKVSSHVEKASRGVENVAPAVRREVAGGKAGGKERIMAHTRFEREETEKGDDHMGKDRGRVLDCNSE
jgi:hypothetical protein